MSRSPRGFTLAEVIVVISMIGLLAVVAAPSFVKMMRDTAVSRAAMQIAEIHRSAQLASSLRTTLVSFRSDTDLSFEIREASLEADEPRIGGARGCNAVDWEDAAHVTSRVVRLPKSDALAPGDVRFRDGNGIFRTRADLCFERQKPFVRYDDGAFEELSFVARLEVENHASSASRTVTVAPSGLPRVLR